MKKKNFNFNELEKKVPEKYFFGIFSVFDCIFGPHFWFYVKYFRESKKEFQNFISRVCNGLILMSHYFASHLNLIKKVFSLIKFCEEARE
jgi:hypothetical protein